MIMRLRRAWGILRRCGRGVQKRLLHGCRGVVLPRRACERRLVRIGSGYGGWWVPEERLGPGSVCYCVGVGVDATFDVGLVERFGCRVVSLDPTPKAVAYMERLAYDRERLTFLPYAVWNEDTELRFYAPADRQATSHSVFDLQGTGEYFTAPAKRVSTIMRELGHERLDLLKLDIEGAWRPVIRDLLAERIPIGVLCAEFDSPTSLRLVWQIVRELRSAGFDLVHYEKDNYLFVNRRAAEHAPAKAPAAGDLSVSPA